MKNEFGRRKKRGHYSFADSEVEPVRHQANGCANKKKRPQIWQIGGQWRALPKPPGGHRGSGVAVLKLRANLPRSSEDGRREGAGVRESKTECFSTS